MHQLKKYLHRKNFRSVEFVLFSKCQLSVADCLGPWSLANMIGLNLSRCSFIDTCGYSLMVRLTNLKNLRYLNVSYTELNQQSLKMICEDLRLLEKVDISGTLIQDLSPLLLLCDRLTSLTVCDLKAVGNMAEVVTMLPFLRHLDISLVNEKYEISECNTVSALYFSSVFFNQCNFLKCR